MPPGRRGRGLTAAALVLAAIACGQKGPPLAPLRLVPAAVTDVSLRRVEDRVRLRFVLPTRNATGPGPIELDRLEIYAVTVGPESAMPANRDLLTRTYLVGHVPVQPPPREGEGEPETPAAKDARPAPGEVATFEEVLTAAELTPAPLEPEAAPPAPAGTSPTGADAAAPSPDAPPASPPPPAAGTAAPAAEPPPDAASAAPQTGEAGAPPTAAAAANPPPVRTEPVRIYVARGVTRGGRPGPPSARVELPIGPLPLPPLEPAAKITETGVLVEWTAPEDGAALSFNVYDAEQPLDTLHPSPVTEPSFEHAAATIGQEHCYRVRSVRTAGAVAIEGPLSEATCITPRDIFPPTAPTGLAAVPTPGQISLIWNANTEGDLAGYLILRGDAPEGQLQALTPSPIRETSYRDTTVQPGMRYVYAVIAVDAASPPNTSAMSERVEETAR